MQHGETVVRDGAKGAKGGESGVHAPGRSGAAGSGGNAGKGDELSPTRLARVSRTIYAALAWIFVACIAFQVFLAGMAVFVDGRNWVRHVNFVHLFGDLPLLMLLFAWLGKVPRGRGLYLWPVGLFILVGMQYALADAGRTLVAALHPVNAMLLFWGAVRLAVAAGRFFRPGVEVGA